MSPSSSMEIERHSSPKLSSIPPLSPDTLSLPPMLTESRIARGAYCILPSTKSFGNVERPYPHSGARHIPAARRCAETFSAKLSYNCRILPPARLPTTHLSCWRGMPHARTILGASSHFRVTDSPRSRVLLATLDPGVGMILILPACGFHNCHALCFGTHLEEGDPTSARCSPRPVRHRGRGCRAPAPWKCLL